jgi:hypothetical protein
MTVHDHVESAFTIAGICSRTKSFEAPGSPWQDGFVESFNGKLCNECLNREWFKVLLEARSLIESWRRFTTNSARVQRHRLSHARSGSKPMATPGYNASRTHCKIRPQVRGSQHAISNN